jgi:hypothetical protein
VIATGGEFAQDPDPQKWIATARRILRAAMPDDLIREPVNITFAEILSTLPSRSVPMLNRTWIKQSAMPLADAMRGSEKLPAAARWTVGTGDVAAFAFSPDANEIGAIEQEIARKPRDPRFSIEWHNGATFHVRIDAQEGGNFLNDRKLTLDLNPGGSHPIPQTSPGRYEIDLPASRVLATASILQENRLLDRFAVAGRYAREFDAVGNDLDALRALAARSGGKVIDPTQHELIELPDTRQTKSMASLWAIVGSLLLAAALVVWRRS